MQETETPKEGYKNFLIAMAVPLFIMALVIGHMVSAIYHGVSGDPSKKGMLVLSEKEFMETVQIKLPLVTARDAIEYAKKNSNILDLITERKNFLGKNKRYHWLAVGLKASDDRWKVNFQEHSTNNPLVCSFELELSPKGKVKFNCGASSKNSKEI